MPSLKPVSKRELVRKLKGLGFEGPFPGGKHEWMRRAKLRVTIPILTGARLTQGSFGESCARQVSHLMTGCASEMRQQ